MSVTYAITGRSAKGGAIKQMAILSAAIKVDDGIPTSGKQDLEVIIEGPVETQPKISIMGGDRGNFHIGFTPSAAGQYWLDFIFKGTLANEPFLLPVKDAANKVPPTPAYTGKLVNRSSGEVGGAKGGDDSASKKREEEERRREEEERLAREEEERLAREDEERLRREEEERLAREEEERLQREDEEKMRRDEEERALRENEEKQRKEEEERLEKEKQDKLRKETDEKDRKAMIEKKRPKL